MGSTRIAGDGIEDADGVAGLPRAGRGAARAAVRGLAGPPAVLLAFVSRGWATKLEFEALAAVARAVAEVAPGTPVVAAESSGALGAGVEREGRTAVSALCLAAPTVRARVAALPSGTAASDHAAWFERATRDPLDATAPRLALALLGPAAYTPETLIGLGRVAAPPVVGGGATRVVTVDAAGRCGECDAAVVAIAAPLGVAVVASPAAKLITPWLRVTKMEGAFLLRADDEPMLDVLTRAVEATGRRESLFVALRPPDEPAAPLLRAIVGVDPKQGAVAINDVLPAGAEVAIAVRDAAAARADHAARLAAVARAMAGGTPAAALMLTCAGRGAGLFGQGDVDAGTFRGRFPAVPFAGMHSAFELAPWAGASRVHLFTAVSALLYRPS